MNETTLKLLPGRLMLVAAILFMAGAIFASGRQSYVLLAVGMMWLCIGIFSLRRTRQLK